MRRPLFLFFIGLVLGEAAAIFLNRIGFFVMALFLLIFYDILFYILSKSQKGTEPFLHIRSVVLVLFSYGRYCVF